MKLIVLTWTIVMAVTSASFMSKAPAQFDLPFQQYTDTWTVQLHLDLLQLPQDQIFVEADALARKHGFINQGQVHDRYSTV